MARPWWTLSYEEREAARPRGRLKAKIAALLKCDEDDAGEVVSLIEEMIEESASDLKDRMDGSGQYSPDY